MTDAPITVRRARAHDLQALLDVHVAHGGREPGDASEAEVREWVRMMATDDLAVYLAEADGHVVGTASSIIMPNVTYRCAPTLFIEAVVVVPELRRRGVATYLLQRVLAEAEEAGCHKVQLLSHKRHAGDGAHALYETLGFAAEAEGFRLYLGSTGAPILRRDEAIG